MKWFHGPRVFTFDPFTLLNETIFLFDILYTFLVWLYILGVF